MALSASPQCGCQRGEIRLRGARLYYEAFGQAQPDRQPIVLIHGATGTGHSNWHRIAPLLARTYHVIVPDCRGHGQSTNDTPSYAFTEMAADTAALVRALGYPRAHIIGHSNGGNVALVTLLEHPDIVQSAVLQAANAYVSPDLVEKEPAVFDPDRVAREAPDWMREMIALHGPTHGEDYWRDLLPMTLDAIITTPNYTPEDLARVQRPTLVIEGTGDRVNALAKHAQFIARHIPDAELWRPQGVGHTVHEELPCPWVTRVLDFLARRGDDANDALYRLHRARYADDRETLFQVQATREADTLHLQGKVLTAEQRDAAHTIVADNGAAAEPPGNSPTVLSDQVHVLLTPSTSWALVNRAVTDLRHAPDNSAERISQALLGEAVRVLETQDGWAHVRLDHDGYLGWVHEASLHRCDAATVDAYLTACGAIVQTTGTTIYASDSARGGHRVLGRLPFGVSVPLHSEAPTPTAGDESAPVSGFPAAGWVRIRLPDGRRGWAKGTDLLPLRSRPQPTPSGIAFTLALICRFVGVPYLWGGRTPFGFDCSGLAQAFLRFMDITPAPRDADQQFRVGQPVTGESQQGDLLFFGSADDEGGHSDRDAHPERCANITHVAIALGEGTLIHANGTAWGVSINYLDPDHPAGMAWLRESLVGVRRYTPGV